MFQRTVRFYISLILLANVAIAPLLALVYVSIPRLVEPVLLTAISIGAYVGFFGLFNLIIFVTRLISSRVGALGFKPHIILRAKQSRLLHVGIHLMPIVIPIAFLIISAGLPFAALLAGFDGGRLDYDGAAGLFDFFGLLILTLAAISSACLTGVYVILRLLAIFNVGFMKTAMRNASAVVLGLILMSNLVVLLGYTLIVFADGIAPGAATNALTSVLSYGLISVFALIFISLPPTCVLFARKWRVITQHVVNAESELDANVQFILKNVQIKSKAEIIQLKSTIKKVAQLVLPSELAFLGRTVTICISAILLANMALTLAFVIGLPLQSLSLGSLVVLGTPFGVTFVGFLALFILSVILIRSLMDDLEHLKFSQRIVQKVNQKIYRSRTVKQAINEALWLVPVALIIISFVVIATLGFSSDVFESDNWLTTAGAWFALGGAAASGIITLGVPILYFIVAVVSRATKSREAIKQRALAAGIILILSANLVAFAGISLTILYDPGAPRYFFIFIFAVVGLLALGALSAMGARRWRERTPPSASEVS